MKLLIFVSVLVLIAQGEAAPSKDEVKVVQHEEVAGYGVVDAGQEAGGVPSPGAFVAGTPAVDEPVAASAGQQRAIPFDELAAAGAELQKSFQDELMYKYNIQAPQTVYIPMVARACTNSACLQICNLLGFKNGICISTTTCQCY